MMPLKPRDNALFVRNFRERLRPHVIGSYAAILFLLVMIFLLSLTDIIAETGRENALFPFIPHYVPAEILTVIALFQGFVLLVLGTFSAYRMALQDRLNGTLDFFRATPTKSLDHVLGLVFGATITEWFFFLLLVPVMFALALLSDVKFAALAEFYAGLALCAVFYHSLGVLAGVCANLKKYRATMNILLLAALICGGAVALIAIKSSVAYHATFLPCYLNLLSGSMDRGTFPGSDLLNYGFYTFFGKPFPSLLFQALVQAPLIVLAWLAIKRKISSAENPLLSGLQLLFSISLILVFFASDSLFAEEFRRGWYSPNTPNVLLLTYFNLAFFLSVIFTIMATPTALGYQKALNRAAKSGLSKPGWFDEDNSNAGWTTILCVLFGVAYFALCARFEVSFGVFAAGFAVLAAFIVFFASAYEFFKLGRFRGKTIIFSTAVLILWIALPITEGIITGMKYIFFFCFSPLAMSLIWGGFITNETAAHSAQTIKQFISAIKSSSGMPETGITIFIVGHLLLFAVTSYFILLAARERKRIKARVVNSNGRSAPPAAPVADL